MKLSTILEEINIEKEMVRYLTGRKMRSDTFGEDGDGGKEIVKYVVDEIDVRDYVFKVTVSELKFERDGKMIDYNISDFSKSINMRPFVKQVIEEHLDKFLKSYFKIKRSTIVTFTHDH